MYQYLLTDTLPLGGSFLGFDGNFFTHRGKDNDVGILLLGFEKLFDLIADLTIRDFDVIFGRAIISHQREKSIFGDIEELILLTNDIGHVHVVGGWAEIFELLASENIDSDQVNFGVTVFAGFGGAHLNDLARTALDDDKAVLTEGRALHRIGSGGARIRALESVTLMLCVVRHIDRWLQMNV